MDHSRLNFYKTNKKQENKFKSVYIFPENFITTQQTFCFSFDNFFYSSYFNKNFNQNIVVLKKLKLSSQKPFKVKPVYLISEKIISKNNSNNIVYF